MDLYICNAFSLNMLADDVDRHQLVVRKMSIDCVRRRVWSWTGPVEWAIGHADVSALAAPMLGKLDPGPRRITVSLTKGDVVIVCQYRGPRLPEGATALPEGARVDWYMVEVV